MTASEVILYPIIWSLAGCLVFSLFVVVAFRSGLVFAARKTGGTLKDRVPLGGFLAMAAFLTLVVAFFFCANRLGLGEHVFAAHLKQLLSPNLGLYVILFAFDTFIFDALLIGVWRPAFLKIPDEMDSSSMDFHVRRSLPVGRISGAFIAMIAAAFSTLIWAGG
jgi:hypothetical protein